MSDRTLHGIFLVVVLLVFAAVVHADNEASTGASRCASWCVVVRGHDASRLVFVGGWGPLHSSPTGRKRDRLPDSYRCECADVPWSAP